MTWSTTGTPTISATRERIDLRLVPPGWPTTDRYRIRRHDAATTRQDSETSRTRVLSPEEACRVVAALVDEIVQVDGGSVTETCHTPQYDGRSSTGTDDVRVCDAESGCNTAREGGNLGRSSFRASEHRQHIRALVTRRACSCPAWRTRRTGPEKWERIRAVQWRRSSTCAAG